MRCGRFICRVAMAVAVAAFAAPALSQEIQPVPQVQPEPRIQPQPGHERGYIVGFGGASFTDVSSPFFGATVGVNIGSDFQVTGEVGHMMDVTAPFTNEDINAVETALNLNGMNTAFSTKVPTTYVTGGGRWLVPTNSATRPYVMGSAGVALLRPEPELSLTYLGVDLAPYFRKEQAFTTAFADENRPLISVGGGVKVDVGRHIVVDVAYRYSRIFIQEEYLQFPEALNSSPTQHSGININRVYAGFGYQF